VFHQVEGVFAYEAAMGKWLSEKTHQSTKEIVQELRDVFDPAEAKEAAMQLTHYKDERRGKLPDLEGEMRVTSQLDTIIGPPRSAIP